MLKFIHLNVQWQLADHTQGGANTRGGGGCKSPPPENIVIVHLCMFGNGK